MARAGSAAHNKSSLRTTFEEDVAMHWTSDRIEWLTNGKPQLHPFSPDKPGVPTLLRVMGLIDGSGALTEGGFRKYQQINKMFVAVEEAVGKLLHQETGKPLRFVDLCAGQGHMALLLGHVCPVVANARESLSRDT